MAAKILITLSYSIGVLHSDSRVNTSSLKSELSCSFCACSDVAASVLSAPVPVEIERTSERLSTAILSSADAMRMSGVSRSDRTLAVIIVLSATHVSSTMGVGSLAAAAKRVRCRTSAFPSIACTNNL